MKKVVLFMALVGVLVSCKKSNSGSNSGYHVTGTVDGTAKAWNTSPIASKITNAGYTMISVDGFTTQGGETFALAITTETTGKNIVAGTYTDSDDDFSIELVYLVNQSSQFAGGTSVTGPGTGASGTVNHPKIIITSIDATSIKGTFSGDVFLNGDPTGAKKTITNGDFNVKFQ